MKILQPLILALSITKVLGGKAPKVKSNPAEIIAIADFPGYGDSNIKGNIVFTAKKGKYVNVHVDVTGLPKEGGPFQYHIHEFPVSFNDCESAGQHFNPYNAPPDCNKVKSDAYCQVGDLSGKHGWINTTCFETSYTDKFLSIHRQSPANILGKSVVFHFANLNKFACANIEVADKERIKDLEIEYDKHDNKDLRELQKFMASNKYVGHTEETVNNALHPRGFDVLHEGDHNHDTTSKVEDKKSEQENQEHDVDDKFTNHNRTNDSNATLNCVSDCEKENHAVNLVSQIIPSILGIMGSLLI